MPSNIGRPYAYQSVAGDDPYLTVEISDLSYGVNSRSDGAQLLPGGMGPGPNQAAVLINADLSTPGQTKKRPAMLKVGDTLTATGGIVGLSSYAPSRSSASAGLLHAAESTLRYLQDQGSAGFVSSWTAVSAGFTNKSTYDIVPGSLTGRGDVMIVQNGSDNAYVFEADGTLRDTGNANDSPPKSLINVSHVNRLWCFGDEATIDKADWLFWGNALPTAYSGAFDRTTQAFKINSGEGGSAAAMVPYRIAQVDYLALFKTRSIWALPLANTDISANMLQPIDRSKGCVAKRCAAQVGDDIWYLAPDGVRSLQRTSEDRIKGFSFPLSYWLKEDYDLIDWRYIDQAKCVWWDSKFFITLPVKRNGASSQTTCNTVWVAWPGLQYAIGTEVFPAWSIFQGWAVSSWAKRIYKGKEQLFAGDAATGKVYQVFGITGADDGTAYTYQEESRTLDFGLPYQKKVGGELVIRALISGNYNITAYIATDDTDYQKLGTFNMAGSGPALPVSLPFTLANSAVVTAGFHLDSYGEWYRAKIKLAQSENNQGDDVTILSRAITAYPVQYGGGE